MKQWIQVNGVPVRKRPWLTTGLTVGLVALLAHVSPGAVVQGVVRPVPMIPIFPPGTAGRTQPRQVFGPNVNLFPNSGKQSETSIAINPLNPNNIIAGSNITTLGSPPGAQGTYTSIDGGVTWQFVSQSLTSTTGRTFFFGSDPFIAFDTNGNAYFSYLLINVENQKVTTDAVGLAKSTDGGLTWSRFIPVVDHTGESNATFEDHEAMAIDTNAGSRFRNNIYLAWSNFSSDGKTILVDFSRSTDGGQTWSKPIQVDKPGTKQVQFAVPAVGPNGEVYVSWTDYGAGQIRVAKSTDGGQTFGPSVNVAPFRMGATTFAYAIPAQPDRKIVAATCIVTDRTGNVYVQWADLGPNGASDVDIVLAKSTDGGQTWSPPRRVNQDPPTSNASQFFGWVAIDPIDNSVNISYYDTRDDPNNQKTNYFLARSLDGGMTFKEMKITTVQSDESANNANRDTGNNYGDYTSIAAFGGNVFPCWTDTRNGGNENIFSERVQFPLTSVNIITPSSKDTVANLTPTIVAVNSAVASQSPFLPDTVSLTIDTTTFVQNGVDLKGGTYTFDAAQQKITYAPPIALSEGNHTVTVSVSDTLGQSLGRPPLSDTITFLIQKKELPSGLQMMAAPYYPLNNNPAFILDIQAPNVIRWKTDVTEAAGGLYISFQQTPNDPSVKGFQPGRAYWLQLDASTKLNIEGQDVAPLGQFQFTDENRPDGSLGIGWHQIASPFPFDVDIPNILINNNGQILPIIEAVNQGIVGNAFWRYDARRNSYQLEDPRSGVLRAFSGSWMLLNSAVKMFVTPVASPPSRSLSTRKAKDENGWELQLTAQAGDYVDSQNYLGFATDAANGDNLRNVLKPPPAPGSRLTVGFPRRQSRHAGLYAKDIRKWPMTARQTFDVDVTCDLEKVPVKLSWDNMTRVPRNVRLTLVDLDSQKRTYMRTTQGYVFPSVRGQPRHLQVIAEPTAGTPMRVTDIAALTSTRSTSGVTVRFNLTQSATISVNVRNLSGRLVRSLPPQTCRAGVNLIQWDLRDQLSRIMPRGVYLLEVIASTDENQVAKGVGMITVR